MERGTRGPVRRMALTPRCLLVSRWVRRAGWLGFLWVGASLCVEAEDVKVRYWSEMGGGEARAGVRNSGGDQVVCVR